MWRVDLSEGRAQASRMAQAAKLNREEEQPSSKRIFPDVAGAESFGESSQTATNFLHDVRVEMKQVNWPSRSTYGPRRLW